MVFFEIECRFDKVCFVSFGVDFDLFYFFD